jgi:hypothetical protein
VADADDIAVAAFVPLASRYVLIVQNQDLVGLPLLKELRQVLADLYAMGPRLPDHAPFQDPMRQFETLPEGGWQQIFNDLLRRLPRELYWSASVVGRSRRHSQLARKRTPTAAHRRDFSGVAAVVGIVGNRLG